jgi:selenocysteine-specific elongation factor
MRVVATAGHVDHGKSTLIKALTGTDPDRLAEEKARGMTIDLGFAYAVLPSGQEVGFIDVPGHARFVKNMLAGLASIDACLFVVDATEGWRAQSEEHLRILELVGVARGLVALTKSCLAGPEVAELARVELAEKLAGSFLEGAEVVATDALGGFGLEELAHSLDRLVSGLPERPDEGRPRLWVDRSFAIRGAGTVVTGTLAGGAVHVGDELVVAPKGLQVRARALQSHHGWLDVARPGRRVAVNLSGAEHHRISRGDALVRPGQWHLTRRFDAAVRVLEGPGTPMGSRGAFKLHVGSASVPVRLSPIGEPHILPAGSGLARIWLQGESSLPLQPGDRFVLREAGRSITIGGGEVLDVDPVLPLSRAAPDRSVHRVVAERGCVEVSHLEQLTGKRLPATVGRWVISAERQAALVEGIVARAVAAGREGAKLASLDEVERCLLVGKVAGVVAHRDRFYLESLVPAGLSEAALQALAVLEAEPWQPPDLPLSYRKGLRELEGAGLAYQAGELWFASSAVARAAELIASLLAKHPEGVAASQVRQALGSTRKYVMPLLGLLDALGFTRRHGDLRVAGPRLEAKRSVPV